RPRGHHRGEGPGPVRRAGLRPQADRPQQARGGRPRGARRDLRRGARRGAAGSDGGLLGSRRLSRRPRRGRRAGSEDHRRHLPVGHQGAPRGEALRERRLRHPADRARGTRRGRGHRRGGSRPHPARPEPGRRARHRRARCRQGRLAVADDPVGRRDARDGGGDPGEVSAPARPAQRRHLLRHPEPSARSEGDLAAGGPGHRRRLAQLLQLGSTGGGRARGRRQGVLPRRRLHRDRGVLARRGVQRVGDLRRLGAGEPRRRRARVPRRARLSRRSRRALGGGVLDLRAAARASSRHARGAAEL
ncbi:MAG: 4-hydroxy-3-methylbut-2-enyl diphosphate reductase, partial [uncultured Nocardioides sp.]